MIKAAVFDVDGTLVDSVDLHGQTWQDEFNEFGHGHPFQTIRDPIGKGGDQLMPVFLNNEEIKAVGKDLEKRRGDILKDRYLPKITSFPQVAKLFEQLRSKGIKTVLASSAKEDELETFKMVAKLEELIDAQTSSDDAEKSKPHPDIFPAALKRIGNPDVDEVIVIADNPYDAEAAAKAGLRTIGMLCGGFPEEKLNAVSCIAIYKDPADLFDRSPLAADAR